MQNSTYRQCLLGVAMCLAGLVPATLAHAKKCSSNGGLIYLGNTRDASDSVWLSATSPGVFELDAAKGNTFVDSWEKDKRGLHLSLSPDVSNGNGGTHKLYSLEGNKPCLIDTQNQKRNFNWPDFQKPDALPAWIPPIGDLFPDFKRPGTDTGMIEVPDNSRPGFKPGLPDTGMIEVPDNSRPGFKPGLPDTGTIQVPDNNLPGFKPGLPDTGMIQIPDNNLPGFKPRLPDTGMIQIPDNNLPGFKPRLPDTGMIQVPDNNRPGIKPGLPDTGMIKVDNNGTGVNRPGSSIDTGTRPPIAIINNGVIRLEGGRLATDGSGKRARLAGASTPRECLDPGVPRAKERAKAEKLPLCSEEVLRLAAEQQAAAQQAAAQASQRMNAVPLTEGREFGQSNVWNFRVGGDITSVSDRRFGLDMDTKSGDVNFSLDRQITDDVVGGVTLTLTNGSTTGFDDAFKIDTHGFSVGPYVAVRLTPHWAVDGSLTYGRNENDMELVFLQGHYVSESYTAESSLHGQYQWEHYFVRPNVTVSYSHIVNSDYDMTGNLGKLPVNMAVPGDAFDYGYIEATNEVSRVFAGPNGKPLLAFAEIGAKYEFERPNGGEMLTGDLSLATPSPWSGSLKAGLRMQLTQSMQFEASGAYLSLGQEHLDIWQGSVKLSANF